MIRPQDLLCPKPEGLYCAPGDFYIDPVAAGGPGGDHPRPRRPRPRRPLTRVLATPQTLAIMAERYGADFAHTAEAAAYGEPVAATSVEVTLVPAGHVLGSAQAVVRWKGLTMVVSGDYKRRRDPTCPPFEPVPCDVFITEATFGLPVFRHPDDSHEIARLLRSVAQFPERSHIVGAYALGKAQRIIRLLREAGWDQTIYVHGALERLNALYERPRDRPGPAGARPPRRRPGGRSPAQIIVAPPSATGQTAGARRFPEPVAAFASGWMRIRARARQKRRRAAAGDLRPRRLGRTHRHRRRTASPRKSPASLRRRVSRLCSIAEITCSPGGSAGSAPAAAGSRLTKCQVSKPAKPCFLSWSSQAAAGTKCSARGSLPASTAISWSALARAPGLKRS